MLQTQSVYPATLELLKQLMAFESLAKFNLVGGTALALQFGHRISVDLDFFSEDAFDTEDLKRAIIAEFGNQNIVWNLEKDYTLLLKINDIKVDILHYPYALIDDVIVDDSIRILSPKDTGAMKLSAVSKRGAKKDFFDLYELLQQYSLEDLFTFYEAKFKNHELGFLARSLLYFEDAEIEEDPIMIKKYSWKQVKQHIEKEVRQYVNKRL